MSNSANLDLNNVLGMIDSNAYSYEVYIPSLQRNVMFKELNTSQQKRLIKSLLDSPIYNTQFNFAMYNIIKENCMETIDINKFTVLDKLFIAMTIRSYSVSDIIELSITHNNTEVKRGISISKIIENVKSQLSPDVESVFTDDKGLLSLTCNIPTIETEYKLEQELKAKLEAVVNNDMESLRDTIGNAFIMELAKYTTDISIKNNDEFVNIHLNNLTFENRFLLLEKLPIKLVEKVINRITEIKANIDKVILLKFDDLKDDKGNPMEKRLTIDGGFFTHS